MRWTAPWPNVFKFESTNTNWEILYMNLGEARPGEMVTVRKVGGEGATMRRIMDMGITKGCKVIVRKVAPLGDPIEITVRGYELSLRKSEASNILVEA